MDHSVTRQEMLRSRSLLGMFRRHWIRVVSLAVILFSPFVAEGIDEIDWWWKTRRAPLVATELAAYRQQRPHQIDQLLPDGARGTGYVPELKDVAGVAFPRRSSMLVAMQGRSVAELAAVEIHERAHLLHEHLKPTVSRIIASVGAPASDTYAATNDAEHFAEMATTAWGLIRPPDGFCWVTSPQERLEDAEQRVPGTAGFVAYFLSRTDVSSDAESAELLRVAKVMTASSPAPWASLWEQLEARRAVNGVLPAWPRESRRQAFERAMASGRETGGAFGTFEVVRHWPSLVLLRLLGA